ncbi:YjbF family lipoprotein [Rhodovulum sp. DZ06]|uniref:YjbF family lipoprotein n=1 Tax=Rhodovulum sp. DZ06 TaxID=3425126 RepID=UPI003D351176
MRRGPSGPGRAARAALRRAAALGLALGLAACGVAGDDYQRAGDMVLGALGGDEPAAPPPNYEQVAALPYATLALRVEVAQPEGTPPALLAATTRLEGRTWYLDAQRRGIGLTGGRLVGTRGMAQDVIGAPLQPGDPLAGNLRPADWPAETLVIQRRRDGLGDEKTRAFACRIENAGPEVVELYQVTRPLVRMREHCANVRGAYVNDHWIDPETGRMWRTRQWAGPETGYLSIAIIKQLGG